MQFSEREQLILSHMLQANASLTVKNLEYLLDVSRRTVYREIANLEESLKHYDLNLQRSKDGSLYIVGTSSKLDQLRADAKIDESPHLMKTDRQKLMILHLIFANEPVYSKQLALDFSVSEGTISQDLDAIDTSLKESHLQLNRSSQAGLTIKGDEQFKRHLVALIYSLVINPYDLFKVIEGNWSQDDNHMPLSLLGKLDLTVLGQVKQELNDLMPETQYNLTDQQLQYLIYYLAFSIQRIKAGKEIVKSINAKYIQASALSLSHSIFKRLEERFRVSASFNERHYLASHIEGFNVDQSPTIFYDHFDTKLSYQTRELIDQVSKRMQMPFYNDNTLYTDLLVHITSLAKREMTIPKYDTERLLNDVINRYEQLYHIIKDVFEEVFDQITLQKFDLAYIVIHFASAMERRKDLVNLKVLVICSSGVGTAKILESRLAKEFPFLAAIDVIRIAQMNRVNYDDYAVILSTIHLPNFDYPYLLVSPLLMTDEIGKIHQMLENARFETNSNDELDGSTPMKKVGISGPDHPGKHSQGVYQISDLHRVTKTAQQLLDRLSVNELRSASSLEETVEHILEQLEPGIVADASILARAIINRYSEAPVGIPDSTIALFHIAHAGVKAPFISVYDLSESFEVLGMDKSTIDLNRILLMIAPDPLDQHDQDLLGRISSSIIENETNQNIYSYGSQADIHYLVNQILLDEIKMKL